MGLTWKAKVFEGFKDMTIAELNKKAGRFKSVIHDVNQTKRFE